MIRANVLGAAIALDVVVGDPPWSPHPVRAMGAAIAAFDRRARRSAVLQLPAGRLVGAAVVVAVVGATYGVAAWCLRSLAWRPRRTVEIVASASTLAWRSLITEAAAVERALQDGDLPRARAQLSRIVGRDTRYLEQAEICRAVIETLAESLCDGIVAPLCYLVVGGAPLALAYKAVNTLDSMIGHIEPPYRYFGWCAAKLDDVANLLPARLSAIMIAAASQLLYGAGAQSARICTRDAHLHRSPNAGWPEAAMAGALGVRLGGTNVYDGVSAHAQRLGKEFRAPNLRDVRCAMTIVTCASAAVAAAAMLSLAICDGRR